MSDLNFDFFINPDCVRTIQLTPSLKKILNSDEGYLFHKLLPDYHPTPLVSLPALAEELDIGELWIKDESHRFGLDAFKGLGASFAVHTYLKKHPGKNTFCTATEGNHGKALAWICRIMGQRCTVFVPGHTIQERIKSIKKEKADVVVIDGNYDFTVESVKNWSEETGAILIQDMSWTGYDEIPSLIMQGYLTSFREMEQKLQEDPVDVIFVQAGVGSWAASAAWYFNQLEEPPQILVIEAFETDCILESIRKNELVVTSKSGQTIMAGLNCGFPSVLAYEILRQGARAFLSIPDKASIDAMKKLYYPVGNDPKIIAGESGAAGLGGLTALSSQDKLLKFKEEIGLNRDSRVLVFNTEGDTNRAFFERSVLNK